MDLTGSLSPLMRPHNLIQSRMLSSLLSVAIPIDGDENACQESFCDDSSKDSRIFHIFASPAASNGKLKEDHRRGTPTFWNTEVQEVLVKPEITVSSINFAHSPDPSVLLQAGGHWQSDGNLPHWIELKLPEPATLSCLTNSGSVRATSRKSARSFDQTCGHSAAFTLLTTGLASPASPQS